MGNYEQLKTAIAAVIKANGMQEITGDVLQATLLSLVGNIGDNATFAGMATPDTNPGTPDQNVFYLAAQPGVYSNFGSVELTDHVLIFTNKNGSWVKKDTGIATKENVEKMFNKNVVKNLVDIISVVNVASINGKLTKEALEDKFVLHWEQILSATDRDYLFFTHKNDKPIKFYENSQFYFRVKNNGSNSLNLVFGITKGSKDWSSGLFVKSIVEIQPGQLSDICFSNKDWKNIEDKLNNGDDTYMIVVVSGQGNSDNLKESGEIEAQYFYSLITMDADHATNADNAANAGHATNADNAANAGHATNADNAANAGWIIGGFARNAVFRDEGPKGFIPDAMTVEEVDIRTVRLITNITEEQVGSQYRGIYWKITFNNFEDIKGLWNLYCTYGQYNNSRITAKIQDWGPNLKDTFAISVPTENIKNTYNLFDLINAFKEEQEALGPDSKWTGAILENKYFYLQLIRYNSSGMLPVINDVLTLDHIPEGTKVIATEFTESVKQEIKEIVTEEIKEVTNWGDSLTAGTGYWNHNNQKAVIQAIKNKGYDISLTATSNITYSIMMQELLGGGYKVNSCGVGGENINTISARLGANVTYAKNIFTLSRFANTPVQIGQQDGCLDSSWGEMVSPLLQGSGNSVNPCYVQGIECEMKWTGESWNDPSGIYTLQRIEDGDRDIQFPQKTPIIMSGSKLYRNTKLAVLWCWQNGGYSSDEDLIEKLDKIIAHINTQNYILIGLHSSTEAARGEQEAKLSKKYGDKFFNWRQYVSTNALYDFGITPTEDDLEAMAVGSCPPSLLIDSVHLCAAGYAILGYKIVERYKDLGYI
jgi:hypothetical protein